MGSRSGLNIRHVPAQCLACRAIARCKRHRNSINGTHYARAPRAQSRAWAVLRPFRISTDILVIPNRLANNNRRRWDAGAVESDGRVCALQVATCLCRAAVGLDALSQHRLDRNRVCGQIVIFVLPAA